LDSSVNTIETHLSSLDSSVNTIETHLSSLDASMTALENSTNNFTENLVVTNDASYNNRVLQIYGETTTIIDISPGLSILDGQNNVTFNTPPIYSDMDSQALTSSNPVFTSTYIDFRNNQGYFKDTLMELYMSITFSFGNTPPTHISVVLKQKGGVDTIPISTQAISVSTLTQQTYCFGPKMFIFKDNTSIQSSTDISVIDHQWDLVIEVPEVPDGNDFIVNNGRMTIKQKSLV